jgi:hypothetical protein
MALGKNSWSPTHHALVAAAPDAPHNCQIFARMFAGILVPRIFIILFVIGNCSWLGAVTENACATLLAGHYIQATWRHTAGWVLHTGNLAPNCFWLKTAAHIVYLRCVTKKSTASMGDTSRRARRATLGISRHVRDIGINRVLGY